MSGSTYINFDKAQGKGMKLIRTGEDPVFGLLIISGINLGLRISDLLSLTFDQLRSDTIIILERKTGKKRSLKVRIRRYLHELIEPWQIYMTRRLVLIT